jgi:hypothetical protein
MPRISSHIRATTCCIGLAALLGACGGGEEGGGTSGSAMSVSAAPSSLAFSGVTGSTTEPPTQQISISSSGGTVYLDVTYAGTAY